MDLKELHNRSTYAIENAIAFQFKVQWIYWLVLIKLIEDIKPSQIGNKEIIDILFGHFTCAFI